MRAEADARPGSRPRDPPQERLGHHPGTRVPKRSVDEIGDGRSLIPTPSRGFSPAADEPLRREGAAKPVRGGQE